MHDLDELRRRLWLAIMVGAVGCDSDESPPAEPPAEVAKDVGTTPQPVPKSGGISGVVKGATASAAATALAKRELEEAERAAFAAKTCETVVDRTAATLGLPSVGELEHGCPRRHKGMILELSQTATLRGNGDKDNCCYEEMRRPVRGRPYTVDGAAQLPGFGARSGAETRPTPTPEHRRVAAGWLHDAREELASVAAFERAALELAQVGAPSRLIDACATAAVQEHRHAELCLSLAEAFAGRSLHLGSPLSATPRRLGLLALLLDTFEMGGAGETVAAAVALRSARGAPDRIRSALLEIAADEAEHAALAWETVAWGLPRLTPSERATFFERAFALGRTATRVGPRGPELDAEHGRMTPAAQAQLASDVWAHVIEPLLHTLGSEQGDAVRSAAPTLPSLR